MNKQESHRILIIRGKDKPITIKSSNRTITVNNYNDAINQLSLFADYSDITLIIGDLELK